MQEQANKKKIRAMNSSSATLPGKDNDRIIKKKTSKIIIIIIIIIIITRRLKYGLGLTISSTMNLALTVY